MDETPTSLHERILYPSAKGPRPPRILHSAAHPVLDPLILDLIALVCREHILTWYSSISSDPDRAFIQQVTAVLVHVIQALEVRLAQVDLVRILAVELPALLEQHVIDFDEATHKAYSGHAHNLNRDQTFHHLQPHMAISVAEISTNNSEYSTEAIVDKTYLRALVENVLRLLLPPEDYRAETERAIVREIISNTVLGGVFTRVAQPWFFHQLLARLLEGRQEPNNPRDGSPSAVSDSAHVKKQRPADRNFGDKAWTACTAAYNLGQKAASGLATLSQALVSSALPAEYYLLPPLYENAVCLAFRLLPPSPALAQIVHYASLPCKFFAPSVNAVIYTLVTGRLLTTSTVQVVLENATKALFPGGHSPPKELDPSPDEQVALRHKCERALAQALPGKEIPLSFFDSQKLTYCTT